MGVSAASAARGLSWVSRSAASAAQIPGLSWWSRPFGQGGVGLRVNACGAIGQRYQDGYAQIRVTEAKYHGSF